MWHAFSMQSLFKSNHHGSQDAVASQLLRTPKSWTQFALCWSSHTAISYASLLLCRQGDMVPPELAGLKPNGTLKDHLGASLKEILSNPTLLVSRALLTSLQWSWLLVIS